MRTENIVHSFDGTRAKLAHGKYSLQSAPISLSVAGPPFIAVAPMIHCSGPVNESAKIWLQTSTDGRFWSQDIEVQRDPHIETAADRLHGILTFFPAATRYLRYHISLPDNQVQPLEMRLAIINPGSSKLPLDISPPRPKRISASDAYPIPDYLPRTHWGTSLGLENTSTRMNAITVTHLWVHHSAGQTNSRDFAAVVRAYYTYHTQTNGWADIGYNWLITPNGTLYQGRAFRRNPTSGAILMDVQGAHARGANAKSIGVCMIGDYTSQLPAASGLRKFVELFSWKAHQMALDVLSTGPIKSIRYNIISGHRDISNTACPGDTFYPYLPLLRQRVHALLNPPLIANLDATSKPPDATSIRLSATIQPQRSRTVWYFEYGTNPELNGAATTSAEELSILGEAPIDVQTQLDGLAESSTYYYRLVAVNSDTVTYSPVQQFASRQATLIERTSSPPIPKTLTLGVNYPNPFNVSTQIRFTLPDPSPLQLSVYDVLGRQVAILATGPYPAGEHVEFFHSNHLPSGIYIYRLNAGKEMRARTMLLLK